MAWDDALPADGMRGLRYQSAPNVVALDLLYGECPTVGLRPRPVRLLRMFVPGGQFFDDGDVVHLHFPDIDHIADPVEAAASADALIANLDRAIDAGGAVVWSVHEPLRKDATHPALDLDMRTRIAERATALHLLDPDTPRRCPFPVPPQRSFVVPLPLHVRTYPDFMSRAAARAALGIDADAYVLLVFGGIRPDKGADRLVAMAADLRRIDRRAHVVIAGRPIPTRTDYFGDIQAAAARTGATVIPADIPDRYVHAVFRAADVAVLPYRESENSAVLMTSLGFGVPTIAPDIPSVRRIADRSAMVRTFAMDDDDDLRAVVADAVSQRWSPTGPLEADVAAEYDPTVIARAFADGLARLVC